MVMKRRRCRGGGEDLKIHHSNCCIWDGSRNNFDHGQGKSGISFVWLSGIEPWKLQSTQAWSLLRHSSIAPSTVLCNKHVPTHKSMIAQQAVHDCGFVQLDHTCIQSWPGCHVAIFCSAIWSLTFMVSAILTMKRSRSGWRDRQKNSILVELTVCQKNVANALNSVVIILKNKVQFVTFPFFFMVELQNFLNAPRTYNGRLIEWCHFPTFQGHAIILRWIFQTIEDKTQIQWNTE